MKSPNNGGDRVLTGHLLLTKLLVLGLGYIQLICWPKRSPNNPSCCQHNRLFSMTDSKAPLLKNTAPTQLIEHTFSQ